MEKSEMMVAAKKRYQKEVGKLDRCKRLDREMKERGEVSPKSRNALSHRMWKIKMRLCGMRSMAKSVGLDPAELAAPEGAEGREFS